MNGSIGMWNRDEYKIQITALMDQKPVTPIKSLLRRTLQRSENN